MVFQAENPGFDSPRLHFFPRLFPPPPLFFLCFFFPLFFLLSFSLIHILFTFYFLFESGLRYCICMYVCLLLGPIGLILNLLSQDRYQENENQALQAMVWLVNFDKIYSGLQKDKLTNKLHSCIRAAVTIRQGGWGGCWW